MNVAFRFNKPFKRVTHSNPETNIPRFIRNLCVCMFVGLLLVRTATTITTSSRKEYGCFLRVRVQFHCCTQTKNVCTAIKFESRTQARAPKHTDRENMLGLPSSLSIHNCVYSTRTRVRLYSSSLSCRSFVATIVVSRLYAWDVTSTRHIPYVRSFISQAAKCHLSSGAITLYCVQNAAHRAMAASTQSAA